MFMKPLGWKTRDARKLRRDSFGRCPMTASLLCLTWGAENQLKTEMRDCAANEKTTPGNFAELYLQSTA